MEPWEQEQLAERIYYRMRNSIASVKLGPGDDETPWQNHQGEYYQQEVMTKVPRVQQFGHSSMPLTGGHAVSLSHGGFRAISMIIAADDVRYRPTKLKPGEQQGYMVTDAKKDGTEGKTRLLWKGILGWTHKVFGKSIQIGQWQDEKAGVEDDPPGQEQTGRKPEFEDCNSLTALAKAIAIGDRTKSDTVTIKGKELRIEFDTIVIQCSNIDLQASNGDSVIASISHVHHVHDSVMPGSADTSPPL